MLVICRFFYIQFGFSTMKIHCTWRAIDGESIEAAFHNKILFHSNSISISCQTVDLIGENAILWTA